MFKVGYTSPIERPLFLLEGPALLAALALRPATFAAALAFVVLLPCLC